MNFHLNYSSNWIDLVPDYPQYHLLHFQRNNQNDEASFVAVKMDSYFAPEAADEIDAIATMMTDFECCWKTNWLMTDSVYLFGTVEIMS